jgi:peptidoglycan/LPS O-acetylase OafA/YrhL
MRATTGFVPALDGLRGLAVAAVLCFHGGFAWASGGFLGVSTFFTLSGFLITGLLLDEWERSGRIDLSRFWDRRLRRLLPPLLVTVLGCAVLVPLAATPDQAGSFLGDGLASLAFLANWRFTAAGQSYADLFRTPSLLLHCWSLGVEGQFYLVAPLALRAALRRQPQPTAWLAAVLGGTVLASGLGTAILVAAGAPGDRIYYGTDTRIAELAVGGVLALWLRQRGGVPPRGAVPLGTAALLTTLWLWGTTVVEDAWLYRGGLSAYGFLSALVLLGAVSPAGALPRLLAAPPLRWLGRVSYAVYLYHWPVFWVLTTARTGLEGWPLFAVRVAITLLLAEGSARVLEGPVRRGTWPSVRPGRVAAVATAVVVGAVVAFGTGFGPPEDPFETAVRELAERQEVENPGDAITYAVFGDSTALGVVYALEDWTKRNPGWLAWRRGSYALGCGIMGNGRRRRWLTAEACGQIPQRWHVRIDGSDIRLAIVQTIRWDIVDQRLPGRSEFFAPGSPDFDAHLLARMELAVDVLTKEGAVVAWMLQPPLERTEVGVKSDDFSPERVARYDELVRELVRRRPTQVVAVDFAGWMMSQAPAVRARLRPDGVHMKKETAPGAADWIGPAVLAAYARLRPSGGD